MQNERYHRVSRDGQARRVDDIGKDEDYEDSKMHQFSPWRKQQFHSLPQDEEGNDNSDNSDLDDHHQDAGIVQTDSSNVTMMHEKSPASSNHGSEGFFDDDMDDVSRYQLDFSDTFMARNLRESISLEESVAQGHISLAFLQQAYRQTQLETRRHRVDQLLSVTRESEKLWITLSSWCDIYDRGLGLLVLITGLWLCLASLLKQRLWTILALLFFLLRISAKPLYWYVRGRHLARRRKLNMQLYEQVNQQGMELTPNKSADLQNSEDVGDESPSPQEREHVVLVR